MTNIERQKKIKDLKDHVAPFDHDKFISVLRYNYLINWRYEGNLTDQEQDELINLSDHLNQLENKLLPLYHELRSYQVKYLVQYDGEVWQGQSKATIPNQKEFFLSTATDIDSTNKQLDLNNADVIAVIAEIRDYIFAQEYSNFTIQKMKRI